MSEQELRLVRTFSDDVVFGRSEVQHIEVERYRNPFLFRTVFWTVTHDGHRGDRGFVPWRSKALRAALHDAGWTTVLVR